VKRSGAVAWVILLAGLTLAFVVRVRVKDMPLERDEGEYAYAGKLILEGTPPYVEVSNMKLPGTYYAYALFLAAFGRTPAGIHLGLAIWTTASGILLFLVARKLFGPLAGAAAASTFAILTLSESVLGLAAHATHFVVLPMLGGTLLLLDQDPRREARTSALAGLLFGLAFLMKQPAAPLVVFGAAALAWRLRRERWPRLASRLGLYAAGAAAPWLAFALYAWTKGFFGNFWFWTVTYAREYATRIAWSEAPAGIVDGTRDAMQWNRPVWVLALCGLVFVLLRSRPWVRAFAGGLALFSFLAVCPGLYFRNHYFIVLLPAVALLAAAGLAETQGERRLRGVPVRRAAWGVALAASLLASLWIQRYVFFLAGPELIAKFMYFTNPFTESIEIARHVRERSAPGDRIAVMGSEPQIYFYADRRSAARYPYTYALMEPHPYARTMQEEMIREVEAARPLWIIVVRNDSSWLVRPWSDRTILTWLAGYLKEHYEVDGTVELRRDAPAVYRWGADALSNPPAGPDYVLLCRRSN
jgi:4-amino-4-deoxy-L-arabinose transferase-like glycosyltransferase